MRHLSNIYDHRRPDAKLHHAYSFQVWDGGLEAMAEEWQHYLDWINANTIGRPKACKGGAIEEMEAMGFIGIWSNP